MERSLAFFPLSMLALLLAFVVVVLGAYTRLTHSGLGCPDWPGCYGHMVVPEEAGDVDHANTLYPDRPLHRGKAWTEMVHRYAAGTLGIIILLLGALGWRHRRAYGQAVKVPLLLVALVIFQAALGMWTVTLLLKPVVVTAHLLGGMAVLALLFWLLLGQFFHGPAAPGERDRLLPWAVAGLCVLAIQIFLGGWTSANYAALACPGFPTCRDGSWWPAPDFREAFILWRGLGIDYEGGVLDSSARTAVHLAHRIGAAVTALGIANVVMVLPLAVAVAHNAVAALLLLSLVALLHLSLVRRR